MKMKTLSLVILIALSTTASAQNKTDQLLGNTSYRAHDVPAGDAGRYYLPGAAAGRDNINPSSYSQIFRVGAHFKAGFDMSCGDMNFYQNIQAEIKSLQYKMQNTIKAAQKSIMASISGAMTSFFQYTLMKINPTLGQLSTKTLDEQLELFNLKVKQCQDYEKDVQNGKNPLGEMVQIAVADQWKKTIGLVNSGAISLEEAESEIVKEAMKNGVQLADGKHYGGENQEPINLSKSLLTAGMNLVMARGDSSIWDSDFKATAEDIKNNPILSEFKSAKELYAFIESIYGGVETKMQADATNSQSVRTIPGKGYELKYVEYRDQYILSLRQYVQNAIDRQQFEKDTRDIIPPAEINDLRALPPYQQAVDIEARAQQYAIKRLRNNLLFAKQALKTGITAPDLQQSGAKAPAEAEYKTLYYKILDDIAEIGQRAYQF